LELSCPAGFQQFMTDQKSMDKGPEAKGPAGTVIKPRKLLRAALLFAGSAALGGLAVALWDRKTLTAMRRKAAEPAPAPPPAPDEDIY
jgi:hypothetical protein